RSQARRGSSRAQRGPSMADIDYRDFDRDLWERELEGFVPPVVYDMHAHMWSEAHRGRADDSSLGLRLEIDLAGHLAWAARLFPGRQVHYLMLGTPVVGMDVDGHNRWLAGQMSGDPESGASLVVTPESKPERVAADVTAGGFVGLKPYRSFAPDPAEAAIRDFLPDPLIEVADGLGLAVTLHLSRRAGPADARNLRELEELTRSYPRVQWILAHCARGFNSFALEESIHVLKGLPNLWYDTAAVNDLYAHYLIMKHEDRARVFFGSDDVVAGAVRGKYVTYGRAWQYFTGTADLPHCDPRATFVVYEQLRQERQVADMLGLTRDEVAAHFAGNGARLLARLRAAA
ncbi:MAG: amidohydrolase family protein, partial [Gemmatimonadota bacterium]